ncbi:MAG: hypothetical protein ACT4OX_17070 [Actinomycetota bacterium]
MQPRELEHRRDNDRLAVMIETPEQAPGLDPTGFRTGMHRTQHDDVRSGPGGIDRTFHSPTRSAVVRRAALHQRVRELRADAHLVG